MTVVAALHYFETPRLGKGLNISYKRIVITVPAFLLVDKTKRIKKITVSGTKTRNLRLSPIHAFTVARRSSSWPIASS